MAFFIETKNGVMSTGGGKPWRMCISPSRALSAAMVKSHTPASSHAWPTAWPRTAAITGLGNDHIFICTSNPLGAGSSSGYR